MNQDLGSKLNKGNLKELNSPEALDIVSLLSQDEVKARFVGGCVRDSLLSKEVKDIDIATPYKPAEVIRILNNHNIKVILTGVSFGTVIAIYNGKQFEITTLREDIETDGRHAKVKYTTDWEKDAQRRDFTINALSYDPVKEEVFDYSTSLEDLLKGKVRFIGVPLERIIEDHLRILRFFRFSAFYSKVEFDTQVLEIIQHNKDLLTKLSGERIKDEIFKLLLSKSVGNIIGIMSKLGLIDIILGENYLLRVAELEYLNQLDKSSNIPRRLYFLLKDKNSITDLAKKWNFSRKIQSLLTEYFDFKIDTISDSYIKYLLYKCGRELTLDLLYIYAAEKKINQAEFTKILEIIEHSPIPIFPISGKDILENHIAVGSKIKESLSKAEKIWINSDFQISKTGLLEKIKN